MQTGILSDGRLSPRKKGDLFWKKYKLEEQAREFCDGNPASRKKERMISYILERYKDPSYVTGEEPDGNEMKAFPSTATGKDVQVREIVCSMRSRDDIPDGDDALIEVIKEYLKEKPKAGNEESDEAEGKTYFKKRIHAVKLQDYSAHIPENYFGQIKNGSLKANEYFDRDDEDADLVGITVTGVHDGWLEIVWVSLGAACAEMENVISFLSFILREAKEENRYRGAFIEMHEVPETDSMVEVLEKVGMTVYREADNNYEFPFSGIKMQDAFRAAAKKIKCRPLDDIDEKTKEDIEGVIMEERTPVPIAIPVPWKDNRGDLSLYAKGADVKHTGLLLISEIGDTLVVELLYGKDPMVTAALLGAGYDILKENVSGDQKILVPIVNENTRPLIKKIAPDAVRGEMAEAIMWF